MEKIRSRLKRKNLKHPSSRVGHWRGITLPIAIDKRMTKSSIMKSSSTHARTHYNNCVKNPPSKTTWRQSHDNTKNYSGFKKHNSLNNLFRRLNRLNKLQVQKNKIMQKLLNFLNRGMLLASTFKLTSVIFMIIISWLSHQISLFRRLRIRHPITHLPSPRTINPIRLWIWKSCWCGPEQVWVVKMYRNKLISLTF